MDAQTHDLVTLLAIYYNMSWVAGLKNIHIYVYLYKYTAAFTIDIKLEMGNLFIL